MLSQLEKRASAQPLVAGPPLDELSIVDDLTVTEPTHGTLRLRWSYRNTGDYDQNSETNISDLTPIGRHFNKTPASADWNRASVADGDLNREVNISDITPIGRCYLQTVTEYRVEFNPTGGAGSEFELFGAAEFAAGEPDANGWLRFDATFGGAASGYYRVVPYYNAERGIAGQPVYFGANQPPKAVLHADPQAGRTPMVVSFDASESSDPEHSVLMFSWDWEGDGVFDLDSGSSALQEHEYTEEGDYAPRVKVRDTKGLEATADLKIVSHNWHTYEISLDPGASSIAVIAGKPAFANQQFEPELPEGSVFRLSYARSKVTVPKTAADWDITVVRPAFQVDEAWISTANGRPELFELDGRPAIFHWIDEPAFANYLAHASVTEPSGPEDWIVTQVNETGVDQVVTSAKAFLVDGKPYVVYVTDDEAKLHLARGLVEVPSGPGDWSITEIATWGSVDFGSTHVGAGVFNGRLCVVYRDWDSQDLMFASCDNLAPTGPGDWQITTLDTEGNCGNQLVLRSVGGLPLIGSLSLDTAGTVHLRLARAKKAQPESAADWSLYSAASGGNVSFWDLLVTEGRCVIMAGDDLESGVRQMLALYPPGPVWESLSGPWTRESITPDTLEVHSVEAQAVYCDGFVVCVYKENFIPRELVEPVACAIAPLPQRYIE